MSSLFLLRTGQVGGTSAQRLNGDLHSKSPGWRCAEMTHLVWKCVAAGLTVRWTNKRKGQPWAISLPFNTKPDIFSFVHYSQTFLIYFSDAFVVTKRHTTLNSFYLLSISILFIAVTHTVAYTVAWLSCNILQKVLISSNNTSMNYTERLNCDIWQLIVNKCPVYSFYIVHRHMYTGNITWKK